MSTDHDLIPPIGFGNLVDLISEDLGGEALICSDDFFASMTNLTVNKEPIWIADRFTERGKWMDGWESRRRRTEGNDWCILRLGAAGVIRAVDIDTRHFLGNHPPFGALDACTAAPEVSAKALRDETQWTELLAPSALLPGTHNLFTVSDSTTWTHVRLRIFPAGGVARLRLWGEPHPPNGANEFDLLCSDRGGRTLACSDQFFAGAHQLISSLPAETMGSGWETRRRNQPGHDWLLLQLSEPGIVSRIELDTRHFKGNFPDEAKVEGLYWPSAPGHLLAGSEGWEPVLSWVPLGAHANHCFGEDQLVGRGPFTHLRLSIFPDGGVSRMRCFGHPSAEPPACDDAAIKSLNAMDDGAAEAALMRCCGSQRWAAAMSQLRPFTSRAMLYGEAQSQWWRLGPADWCDAFSQHPQIGDNPEALRAKFASTASWAKGEQAGMAAANEATITELAQGNRAYVKRFGYIFIVCATGKTAAQMLALLHQRLPHDIEQEIFVAATEQAKITNIRLEKLT